MDLPAGSLLLPRSNPFASYTMRAPTAKRKMGEIMFVNLLFSGTTYVKYRLRYDSFITTTDTTVKVLIIILLPLALIFLTPHFLNYIAIVTDNTNVWQSIGAYSEKITCVAINHISIVRVDL